MSTAGALLLLAALLVFAAGILFAMSFVFAHLTGWSALARRHPATERFTGERYRVQGAILGPWGWNAPPLSLGLSGSGIELRALPPFGFAFRPISIPWSAVESVARREALLFHFLELRFEARPEGSLGFVGSPALLRHIEDAHAASRNRPDM
jgi:hypothetical protein